MKALVGALIQEKALVGAFSVIVQPVVEPMEHYSALVRTVCSRASVRSVVTATVASPIMVKGFLRLPPGT